MRDCFFLCFGDKREKRKRNLCERIASCKRSDGEKKSPLSRFYFFFLFNVQSFTVRSARLDSTERHVLLDLEQREMPSRDHLLCRPSLLRRQEYMCMSRLFSDNLWGNIFFSFMFVRLFLQGNSMSTVIRIERTPGNNKDRDDNGELLK